MAVSSYVLLRIMLKLPAWSIPACHMQLGDRVALTGAEGFLVSAAGFLCCVTDLKMPPSFFLLCVILVHRLSTL
jgi:hypothetical protein